MTARQLADLALEHGLILEDAGDGQVRIVSPLGRPVPPRLRELVRAQKAELVAFLRRRDEALELACRVCVQAAELLHAAGREGGERLRAAGELLTEAVFAYAEGGERAPLEAAAADYLGLARRLAGVAR